MSADTSPTQSQGTQQGPKRPTPKELDARAEELKKKIDKHLGRGKRA